MKNKIIIKNDDDKKYYYNLLDSVKTKSAAYKLLGLHDNTYGKKELDRISQETDFDLNIYVERRQAIQKFCILCGKELKRGQQKFCSSSCAATFNNLHRDKKIYEKVSLKLKKEKPTNLEQEKKNKLKKDKKVTIYEHFCLNCGEKFSSKQPNSHYCSNKCISEHRHKISYEDFLNNNEKYCRSNYTPKAFKNEFMKEQNNKCAICGCLPEHNNKHLVFIVDHIDGDASNNKRENLRMICPNCDSQLDTYKSKNKNSSRRNYWKEKIIKDLNKNREG